jgi:hypothetical protein
MTFVTSDQTPPADEKQNTERQHEINNQQKKTLP